MAWVNHYESFSTLIEILWGSSENLVSSLRLPHATNDIKTIFASEDTIFDICLCFVASKLPVFQPHLGQK